MSDVLVYFLTIYADAGRCLETEPNLAAANPGDHHPDISDPDRLCRFAGDDQHQARPSGTRSLHEAPVWPRES